MIEYKNGIFGIHGEQISCLLRVNAYGLLEPLRFGARVAAEDAQGFILQPGFRGTGYDKNQRTLTDFGSELYRIEEETEHE